jgi:hypothetical protein
MANEKLFSSPWKGGESRHRSNEDNRALWPFWLMNQLVLEREFSGHDVVSKRFPIVGLRFDVEHEDKTKATTIKTLYSPYAIFIFSLRSLGLVCRKRKLKNQIPRIEETNSDPYE